MAEEPKTYKTVVQIGYQKAGALSSRGQLVSAYVGSPLRPGEWVEVQREDGKGEFLHGRTSSPYLWWYAVLDLEETDLLKISTKVGIVNVGPDEEKTMDVTYRVDPSVGLVQITWKGIGYKSFPLAKGYLQEVSRDSLAQHRLVTKVVPLLENDF